MKNGISFRTFCTFLSQGRVIPTSPLCPPARRRQQPSGTLGRHGRHGELAQLGTPAAACNRALERSRKRARSARHARRRPEQCGTPGSTHPPTCECARHARWLALGSPRACAMGRWADVKEADAQPKQCASAELGFAHTRLPRAGRRIPMKIKANRDLGSECVHVLLGSSTISESNISPRIANCDKAL
eukprot:gene12657-biopygen2631